MAPTLLSQARRLAGCDLTLDRVESVQPEWRTGSTRVYRFDTVNHPWPEIDRCFCWEDTDPSGQTHLRCVLGSAVGPIESAEEALRYYELSARAPAS